MRKAYVKPEIFFEDFSLSSSIAGSCDYIVNTFSSSQSCYIEGSGGIRVFNLDAGVSSCEYAPGLFDQPDDMWDGLCYHNPTDGNNLFNS